MMKKAITLFCIICLSCNLIFSQEVQQAKIKDAKFQINSFKNPELIIKLYPQLPKGFAIDDEDFFDLNKNLMISLISKNDPDKIFDVGKIECVPAIDTSIRFIITNYNQQLHDLILSKDIELCLKANKNIVFSSYKESKTEKYEISQADIQKYTTNVFVLTPAMNDELILAKGGAFFMVNNNINFGVIPSEESSSTKTEYYAEFKYLSKYSFVKKANIFFYTEGLLSTNSKDSLNYLSVYPISYNFISGTNELVGQIGVEGNQTFTNYRVSGNFYWNGLLPNFVNLTFNEDRLRLKPVVKAGLKIYQEIENNRAINNNNKELSNQVFTELYYYIPIKKIYSLILDGTLFYDFNKKVNPNDELKYNYSVALGIDIPKTEFKTIFKYSYGENGISYEKNSTLMIGFLLDIMDIK